ncbi:MAG: glycosyltransferase [Pelotomaculum sp.]
MQTKNLKSDLETIGIKNIYILSNLKRLNSRKKSDLNVISDKYIRVCVFSRMNYEKGVEDAIAAVKLANQELGAQYIALDFYGLVQDYYEDRFNELLSENKGLIKYCGIVDYDNTVETLQQYFAMLFPTFYYGEGFPGNVVDAYNTGIPIIATDWMYNKDVIKDGRNGILVPIKNPQAICDALIQLYRNRKLAYDISCNNIEDAQIYHPDSVLREFYEYIDR